jgi:carbonic anhydrase/acetyltransferase-like protein (isoleucine patch superfamily)
MGIFTRRINAKNKSDEVIIVEVKERHMDSKSFYSVWFKRDGSQCQCITGECPEWLLEGCTVEYSMLMEIMVDHSSLSSTKGSGTSAFTERVKQWDKSLLDSLRRDLEKPETSKKYEKTDDIIGIEGGAVKRIRALKDFSDVKAGDLGGYIMNESNLSQEGDCWIYDNAVVRGNAAVVGSAKVKGFAEVSGSAVIRDSAVICDNARVDEGAVVYTSATVCGDAIVKGDSAVSGHAVICGSAVVEDDAEVYGWATVGGHAKVCNSAKVYGNAAVTKYAEVCGHAVVAHNIVVSGHTVVDDDTELS